MSTRDNPQKAAPSKQFTCANCGGEFSMSTATLDRYPGWKPSQCPKCYSGKKTGKKPGSRSGGGSRRKPVQGTLLPREQDSSPVGTAEPIQQASSQVADDSPLRQALDEVLATYDDGPREGLFTDGASHGNPGPGGWGAVYVRDDAVLAECYGRSPDTTNNRMELRALLAAFEMIGPEDDVTIWSDSQLCVNTINQWAAGWKRRGWKRKGGAIKNLDLVRPLYELSRTRPRAKLTWIKAHAGLRWNEYADTLADPDL